MVVGGGFKWLGVFIPLRSKERGCHSWLFCSSLLVARGSLFWPSLLSGVGGFPSLLRPVVMIPGRGSPLGFLAAALPPFPLRGGGRSFGMRVLSRCLLVFSGFCFIGAWLWSGGGIWDAVVLLALIVAAFLVFRGR